VAEAPGRQLTRHGADRKAELLRSAEALFIERGFDETRMVDIAERAGVAKGLAYWYFENKDALFREIIADVRERLRRAMATATAPHADDPLATIHAGVAEAVRFIAEHHRMFSLIRDVSGFRDAHAESAQLHATDTARVIREGQRRGVIRADEDAFVMAMFNSGVVTQAVAAIATGSVDTETAAEAAARYVVRALTDADDRR
jgi:TetR/AcrR family fatty acid metabolism transcriptional regulator